MVNAKFFLASVAAVMVMPSLNDAHSWVDCMDWRFNGGKQSFDDNAGSCAGYARRFPVKYNGNQVSPKYAFGSLDSADPNRHYKQSEKNPDDWPACSTGKTYKKGEDEEVGSDETKANPIDGAYGQGKWGPITVAKAGQQLCVRWPAKNHKDEPNNVVFINMPPTPMSQDPTQRQLNQWTIAKLDYGNCFSGGSDKARCGGCFTIPENRGAGDYLIQWRWKLNGSDNAPEWYTSCSDVRITNGKGGVAPTVTSVPEPTSTKGGEKATPTKKNGNGGVSKPTPTPPHYKKPEPTHDGGDNGDDDEDDEDNGDEDDEDNGDEDDEDNGDDDEDDEDNGDDEDEDDDQDDGEDDGDDDDEDDGDDDDEDDGDDDDEDDGDDDEDDEDNGEDDDEDDGDDDGDDDDEDDGDDDEDDEDNGEDNHRHRHHGHHRSKRSDAPSYPLYNLRRSLNKREVN